GRERADDVRRIAAADGGDDLVVSDPAADVDLNARRLPVVFGDQPLEDLALVGGRKEPDPDRDLGRSLGGARDGSGDAGCDAEHRNDDGCCRQTSEHSHSSLSADECSHGGPPLPACASWASICLSTSRRPACRSFTWPACHFVMKLVNRFW